MEVENETQKLQSCDVALIGGSGFIASTLLRHFESAGLRTLVCGRNRPQHPGFEFQSLDLNSVSNTTAPKLRTVGTVVFNSVYKGRFERNTPEWFQQGTVCAPDLTRVLAALGIQTNRLITFGSSEEYGARQTDALILETDPTDPLSSHGYWKTQTLKEGLKWCAADKLRKHLHVRPFIVYGPKQDPAMFIGACLEKLHKNEPFKMTPGEQWRSFLHVEDLSRIILGLIQKPSLPSGVLNLSSPDYFQIREVAEKIYRLVGKGKLEIGALPYREFEVWHQKPSLERFMSLFPDFRFRDFDSGLRELIK